MLLLDLSDIREKYAQKMEYASEVRDGSEKVVSRSYWTYQAVGTDEEGSLIISGELLLIKS